MKNLIVSLNTYSWIKFCAGLVLNNNNEFEIMVVNKDNKRTLLYYKKLCKKAIYEQRRNDMFNISKKLGVKKTMNLGYYGLKTDSDIKRFITQLTFFITLGGTKTVYYEYNDVLNSIFTALGNQHGIDVYSFNNYDKVEPDKIIEIDDEKLEIKKSIHKLMIGVNNQWELDLDSEVEKFYKD